MLQAYTAPLHVTSAAFDRFDQAALRHFDRNVLPECLARAPGISGMDVLQNGSGEGLDVFQRDRFAVNEAFRARHAHGDRTGNAVGDAHTLERLFILGQAAVDRAAGRLI